jgi:hypothetical protein
MRGCTVRKSKEESSVGKKLRLMDKMKVFKGYTVDLGVDKVKGGHRASIVKHKTESCDTVVFFKAKNIVGDEHRSSADLLDMFRNGSVITVEGTVVLITEKWKQ